MSIDKHECTFAQGLRNLADVLEDGDHDDYYRYLIFAADKAEMLRLVRKFGGRWEKDHGTSPPYFGMTRELGGGVSIHVFTGRDRVCERIVTGTEMVRVPDPELVAAVPLKLVEREIVEWVCPDSLMAG